MCKPAGRRTKCLRFSRHSGSVPFRSVQDQTESMCLIVKTEEYLVFFSKVYSVFHQINTNGLRRTFFFFF